MRPADTPRHSTVTSWCFEASMRWGSQAQEGAMEPGHVPIIGAFGPEKSLLVRANLLIAVVFR
jgi:hypothetical protein